MSHTIPESDVVIIGAGPAGLFTVFECGLLGLSCQVVDALDMIGGQLAALYPEKPIYDIPGFPEIMASDLVERLGQQAAAFTPQYHLGSRAETLEPGSQRRWRLTLGSGAALEADAVIIAAGVGAFGPNRPPLDGLAAYEGHSVFYLVRRREDFRNKRVVIAGGGDSAVDWALSLAKVTERLYVVHRRAKFRAAPDSVSQLQRLHETGGLELVTPFQLHSLIGDKGQLSAVVVSDLDGNQRTLEAEILLPFYGLSTNLGPLTQWGLRQDEQRLVVDPATCATNLDGVFAIGDIATYAGKLKLILCGFAEAATAARAIYAKCHPDAALHVEHSTTLGKPGSK